MTHFESQMTWIEISANAYQNNINSFSKILGPGTNIKSVIKANGYGHGLRQMVELANLNNIHSFAVHSLDEAKNILRLDSLAEILIMGPVLPINLSEIIESGIHFVVYDFSLLGEIEKNAKKLSRPANIHLKIETGTNRLGLHIHSLKEFLNFIYSGEYIQIHGIYTHFANIEDSTDHTYAFQQLQVFNEAIKYVTQERFPKVNFHTACSAAILLMPETHFDLVRLGLSQYGLWPSRETFVSFNDKYSDASRFLTPILSFKTRIGQLKTVEEGQYIGYGCTYRTTRDSRIAVLPIGYSDGLDRKISNHGYVLIRGKRAPIRGRICMNLTMVDVTDIPDASPLDLVTVIGKDGSDEIRVEDLANWSGTINYEVIARLNRDIRRIIVS